MPPSNEQILEIRYRPAARVLDHRGVWAEELSKVLGLPKWQIVQNRLDVYEEGRARVGFLSFRNLGFLARDTPTKNYFTDQAAKYTRAVFALKDFGAKVAVTRVGVRSKFCDPFAGSFEDLRSRWAQKYLSITPDAKQAIGLNAELIDVGASLNYRDAVGTFNTGCGPMAAAQFPSMFEKDDGFPPVGLFYDIDYFKLPNAEFTADEIVHALTDFATAAWDRHERIRQLICGA